MSRKHDLAYERDRAPLSRDDSREETLTKQIFNLGLRLDALDAQVRDVVKARETVRKKKREKEAQLAKLQAPA